MGQRIRTQLRLKARGLICRRHTQRKAREPNGPDAVTLTAYRRFIHGTILNLGEQAERMRPRMLSVLASLAFRGAGRQSRVLKRQARRMFKPVEDDRRSDMSDALMRKKNLAKKATIKPSDHAPPI